MYSLGHLLIFFFDFFVVAVVKTVLGEIIFMDRSNLGVYLSKNRFFSIQSAYT